ncbi:MAG: zf-HC2 domain-containing protein [Candidatus Binataceae bacterium]
MNCFEAQKEFVRFWRRELPPADTQVFTAHLSECVRCDRAFRVFALSASVLQSESEPDTGAESIYAGRQSAQSPRYETRSREARWAFVPIGAALAIAAAVMLFVYTTNVPPYQTLANTLVSDSAAENVNYVPDNPLLSQNVNAADFATLSGENVLGQASLAEDVTVPAFSLNPSDASNLAD